MLLFLTFLLHICPNHRLCEQIRSIGTDRKHRRNRNHLSEQIRSIAVAGIICPNRRRRNHLSEQIGSIAGTIAGTIGTSLFNCFSL
ncbi:hypothetical protein Hanom_Chr10g00951261 [Helianthus anomalus]